MPSLAVREYKVALTRAMNARRRRRHRRCGHNLALAQMRSATKAALATVRDARADLERRHVQIPAELFLVEAAAAYRIGDYAGASAAAQQALDRQAKDPDTVPRAWFIRGLVAAERGDSAALGQAIAALPPTKQADLEADRQELQGRAALLDNRPADALALFQQSAANRQQALDYRGMARELALGGDIALLSSRAPDSAYLSLRAGRSALLQGDTATALPLLKQAEDLARQTAQASIVEEVARLRKAAAERATRA
jgi:hypothetical protein